MSQIAGACGLAAAGCVIGQAIETQQVVAERNFDLGSVEDIKVGVQSVWYGFSECQLIGDNY